MIQTPIRLTISAEIDKSQAVETWLFTYGEVRQQKFGYMTLDFAHRADGCKISVKGVDGLPIDGMEVDESEVSVQISEFESLPLADYIEMTCEMMGGMPVAAKNDALQESYCFEMPNVGRFAKELFGVRN